MNGADLAAGGLVLAAVAVVVDMTLLALRLSGRLGEQARSDWRVSAYRIGGTANLACLFLCMDLLAPWFTLPLAASCWHRDRARAGRA